jgi:hypothetical protein
MRHSGRRRQDDGYFRENWQGIPGGRWPATGCDSFWGGAGRDHDFAEIFNSLIVNHKDGDSSFQLRVSSKKSDLCRADACALAAKPRWPAQADECERV